MKTSTEFVVGKHNIGYVGSDFISRMGDIEFSQKETPTFKKLNRRMTDAEIESQVKPGLCELGDVLAFLDSAPEESKDGYANLFYTSAFVVSVAWDGGGWHVFAWGRDGGEWGADRRVFSPATVNFGASSSVSSESLTLKKAIEIVKKGGYVIFKPI